MSLLGSFWTFWVVTLRLVGVQVGLDLTRVPQLEELLYELQSILRIVGPYCGWK